MRILGNGRSRTCFCTGQVSIFTHHAKDGEALHDDHPISRRAKRRNGRSNSGHQLPKADTSFLARVDDLEASGLDCPVHFQKPQGLLCIIQKNVLASIQGRD